MYADIRFIGYRTQVCTRRHLQRRRTGRVDVEGRLHTTIRWRGRQGVVAADLLHCAGAREGRAVAAESVLPDLRTAGDEQQDRTRGTVIRDADAEHRDGERTACRVVTGIGRRAGYRRRALW